MQHEVSICDGVITMSIDTTSIIDGDMELPLMVLAQTMEFGRTCVWFRLWGALQLGLLVVGVKKLSLKLVSFKNYHHNMVGVKKISLHGEYFFCMYILHKYLYENVKQKDEILTTSLWISSLSKKGPTILYKGKINKFLGNEFQIILPQTPHHIGLRW